MSHSDTFPYEIRLQHKQFYSTAPPPDRQQEQRFHLQRSFLIFYDEPTPPLIFQVQFFIVTQPPPTAAARADVIARDVSSCNDDKVASVKAIRKCLESCVIFARICSEAIFILCGSMTSKTSGGKSNHFEPLFSFYKYKKQIQAK